jgi:outer membrane biosynthesis protein TonB
MKLIIVIFIIYLLNCNSSVTKKDDITSGTQQQTSFKNVIQRESKRLLIIYENNLKRNPTISGKLNVKFSIQPDGKVINVSNVLCTISDSQFVSSVINHVAKWQFPKLNDTMNIEVIYPFVFEGAN